MADYDDRSEDNNSQRPGGRLLVNNEGLLDESLLKRTEGYLFKKGGAVNARGGFRNWKKRWFVIAPMEVLGVAGYELQYYDGPNGALKGKVGLNDIEVMSENKSQHKSVKFEFQIVLQNGGVLQLSCDNEVERSEWIETLNMITMYLRKALSATAMTLDGYDPFDEDNEDSFNIGEEIAKNCQAFGPGLFGAEAGVESQLVLQIHDLMGQQVNRGGMPVSVTISDDAHLYYARVIDNEDGTYFSQYVLGRAGKYNLNVRLNDEHDVLGSPFAIEILPSRTIPHYCYAEGEVLQSIVANETQTFTIYAMDGFGNRKNKGGDPFEVGVMGPAQLKSLVDNGDGSYTCSVTANSPSQASYITSSSILIMITLHGKPINGSPFKPEITEDLRAMYAPNNVTSPASVSGAASLSSSATKHLMAMQPPPPFASSSATSVSGRSEANVSVHSQSVASSRRSQQQGGGGVPTRESAELNLARELDLIQEEDAEESAGGAAAGFEDTYSDATGTLQSPPPADPPSLVPTPQSQLTSPSGKAATATPFTPNATASPAASTVGGSVRSNIAPPSQQSLARGTAQQPAVGVRTGAITTAATAATSAMPAPAAAGGAGLSRLERSRQRALLAKALAENNSSGVADASFDNNNGSNRLEELQRSMANSSLNGGNTAVSATTLTPQFGTAPSAAVPPSSPPPANLQAAAQRTAAPFSAQRGAPRQVNAEFLNQVLSGLQLGLGVSPANANSTTGASGAYPSNATQNEIKIWESTHKAFSNEEVMKLLCSNLETLKNAFDTFADTIVEGVQVLKLTTSGSAAGSSGASVGSSRGVAGGMYQLLELYGITPTYLSKVEAKVLFTLTLHAQRHLRTPASSAGGGTGLEFSSFLKFLVMISYHALSKTNNYSSLYSTMEAKVEVMLFKWGLGDSLRLQVVQNTLRSAASANA